MQVKEHQMVGSYAMSKAALNMLVSACVSVCREGGAGADVGYVKAYKQKTEKPEFTVITLCPGWVQTGMYSACLHDLLQL